MNLKNYLLLICGGIALSAPAIARNPHQTTLPKPPGMSDRVYSVLNGKFQGYDRAVRTAGNTAAKTTASAQRVIGGAYYEWSGSTPTLIDSAALKYSGQRGSLFSDLSLDYDFGNSADQPGDVQYQDSYVQYDTMKVFSATTGVNSIAWRTYNSSNKVTRADNGQDQRKLYSYLSNSKLSSVITLSDLGSGLDTSQREFYTYNTNGLLFKDSLQVFDSSTMSWMHVATYQFTTTAAGRINGLELSVYTGGAVSPYLFINYTYAANGKVSTVLTDMLDFNTGSIVPYSKDTIGYTGNTMVYEDFLTYDDMTGSYELAYTDRRRLNAQGLPDSVSQISPNGGNSIDYKLVYDANNYPTRIIYTESGAATPEFELFYYYQLVPTSVPTMRATAPLAIAPNPTRNQIRLDNKLAARFRILDINGRLMMDGNAASAASIDVEALTPGMYSIMLSDASGETFSGRFVKQ